MSGGKHLKPARSVYVCTHNGWDGLQQYKLQIQTLNMFPLHQAVSTLPWYPQASISLYIVVCMSLLCVIMAVVSPSYYCALRRLTPPLLVVGVLYSGTRLGCRDWLVIRGPLSGLLHHQERLVCVCVCACVCVCVCTWMAACASSACFCACARRRRDQNN